MPIVNGSRGDVFNGLTKPRLITGLRVYLNSFKSNWH